MPPNVTVETPRARNVASPEGISKPDDSQNELLINGRWYNIKVRLR